LSDYYGEFARANQKNYATLQPEWENLTAAIRAAYQQQRWALILDYTDTLTQSWLTQARFSEARQIYAWADEAAIHLPDEARQALNLLRWGEVCLKQSDYSEASERLNSSLALFTRLDQPTHIADVQYHLARLAKEQNRYDEAKEFLASSLVTKASLGDLSAVAKIMYYQAAIHYELGALDEARQVAKEALALQNSLEDKRNAIETLQLLGHIMGNLNLLDDAYSYADQARQFSADLYDAHELAASLYTMTTVLKRQGKFEKALGIAQESLALVKRVGIRRGEGHLLHHISLIYKALSNYALALEFETKSLAIFRTLEESMACALSLRNLVELYQILEQEEAKTQALQEAWAIGTALNHTSFLESLRIYQAPMPCE
jgi:tetratricopeptide (TPR) repeat protein